MAFKGKFISVEKMTIESLRARADDLSNLIEASQYEYDKIQTELYYRKHPEVRPKNGYPNYNEDEV